MAESGNSCKTEVKYIYFMPNGVLSGQFCGVLICNLLYKENRFRIGQPIFPTKNRYECFHTDQSSVLNLFFTFDQC